MEIEEFKNSGKNVQETLVMSLSTAITGKMGRRLIWKDVSSLVWFVAQRRWESSESGKWGRVWSWSRKQGVAECESWSRRAGVGWICDWSSLLRVREITRGFVWGQEQTGTPSGYLCACGTWGTLERLTLQRSRWTWFWGEPPVNWWQESLGDRSGGNTVLFPPSSVGCSADEIDPRQINRRKTNLVSCVWKPLRYKDLKSD